ncbi:hypothetical protein MKX03_031020 [Papaver bracteatum]|nr:hypothetical protein MKX03_031020 [Papaver bracteatum]
MGIFFSQVFRLLCFILLLAHIPPSPTPPLLSPVQPPSPTPPHPTVQPYRPPSPSRHSDSGRFADMPRAPPDFVYRKPGSGRP